MKNFEEIWTVLPHSSFYQILLICTCAFYNIMSYIWVYYPIFAFYRPDFTCLSSIEIFCKQNQCLFDPMELNILPNIDTNQCDILDYSMSSVEKCISKANDVINDLETCLELEPLIPTDCSQYNYNTTGIESYDDAKFKETS